MHIKDLHSTQPQKQLEARTQQALPYGNNVFHGTGQRGHGHYSQDFMCKQLLSIKYSETCLMRPCTSATSPGPYSNLNIHFDLPIETTNKPKRPLLPSPYNRQVSFTRLLAKPHIPGRRTRYWWFRCGRSHQGWLHGTWDSSTWSLRPGHCHLLKK